MAGRRDELHERRTGYRGRRPLLADAAITILARDGGRGLTHRAVDREARVPEGTTKNYYPTRHTILEAAAHRMAEHHRAAVDQLRDTTPAGVTPHQLRQLYPALIRRAAPDGTALPNAEAGREGGQTEGGDGDAANARVQDAGGGGVIITQLALP